MRSEGERLQFSAGDLTRYLACHHVTELDRAAAEGRIESPTPYPDPVLELLQQRGLEHEADYVQHLRDAGDAGQVVELREFDGEDAASRTIEAMRAGAGVIVQAVFRDQSWYGRADLLLRVSTPSSLGDWSYEVADTKIAQETKGGTILQLSLYSELLTTAQGVSPEWMHVVKPGHRFQCERYRFAEYAAYYRLVKRRFERGVTEPPNDASYPLPVGHCDICRWWSRCDARWRRDDHLTLVAGMRNAHAAEFERQGVTSLEQLGDSDEPLPERPRHGSKETYERLGAQAAVQLKGRRDEAPVYELIDVETERGLCRLPEPDAGDIFFDIEGDPLLVDGGREYLFGYAFQDGSQEHEYRALWGRSAAEEKSAFETFIDFVMNRWREQPGMHVYHYGAYEVGAVKRLMSRYATREAEVDRLLRGGRFVDLLTVTRQGVRASVERYSLKDLEPFHAYEREQDLRMAGAALRRVSLVLQMGTAASLPDADKATVELYNQDDCLSTARLRDWLEERRAEWATRGRVLERPKLDEGDASDAVQEREQQVAAVFDPLVAGLSDDREQWSDEERARMLLAHQLEYFRREDRCVWWEYFRLHGLETEELLEERKAITGLQFAEVVGGTPRCPIHRYCFPLQETSLGEGSEVHVVGGDKLGTIDAISLVSHTVDIKKMAATADVHPESVVELQRVSPSPLDTSVLALARSIVENGMDGEGPYRAARDLLMRRRPRLATPIQDSLRRTEEVLVTAAKRIVSGLDGGVLPIQGPPGTGKTHTAAEMIVSLAADGKKIGVTAVSHKVIRNLLAKVVETAARYGRAVDVVHKVKETGTVPGDGVREVTSNDSALTSVQSGAVVGGTAWLWSRDDAAECLDYLFVDEAGQVSLVQALAASRSARNLVLIGDPQQLEQPQQGSHPEGADVAALQHIIGEADTVAEDRGLFLNETRRLHPNLCAYTSETYYEDRLTSRAGLERQELNGTDLFDGAGLFYVPVQHAANQNKSAEEVEAVLRVVQCLLREGSRWTNAEGTTRPLTADDVLIVAPYNAQVGLLEEALPQCRVGTVDRFQGQEAPVVIYSMTSSSALDAPRGMSFLYNPNRLNVATSRARCVCILVACPDVLEPECHSPRQMKWASGLCRYRELAREIRLDGSDEMAVR
jgi:predicted RecB family nuclease